MGEVITIVSFYRYIRAYDVPALLFSIEVVVDVVLFKVFIFVI